MGPASDIAEGHVCMPVAPLHCSMMSTWKGKREKVAVRLDRSGPATAGKASKLRVSGFRPPEDSTAVC